MKLSLLFVFVILSCRNVTALDLNDIMIGHWNIQNSGYLSDIHTEYGVVEIYSDNTFKLVSGTFGAIGMGSNGFCSHIENSAKYRVLTPSLVEFIHINQTVENKVIPDVLEIIPDKIILRNIAGGGCGALGYTPISILTRIENSTTEQTTTNPPISPSPTATGQAIIIAAGGAHPNNTLFRYSNDFTQRMYRLLRMRGYSDEDIIYLNPHAPDIVPVDGYLEADKQDFDLFDPQAEIEQAFAQARLRLQAGQQFVLYVHGHARVGHLDIRPPYELSAQQLRQQLDSLPADVEQIIILDTCFSGSFIAALAAPGRTLLTSTDDASYTWNSEYTSFSDLLIRDLRRGKTLGEIFPLIHQKLSQLSGRHQAQTPWLDDDGDGLFSTQDGTRTANMCLGSCDVHGNQIPEITQIQPSQEISSNIALLWAEINQSHETIRKVRAILRSPTTSGGDYQGQDTAFGRIEVDLPYDATTNRFQASYDRFCTQGLWDLFYQAQSDDGSWSDIKEGQIRQTQNPDTPVCQTNVSIEILLNKFVYQPGDNFSLGMQVDGQQTVTPYIAIILPDGSFVTYSYNLGFSFPNALYPYRETLDLDGLRTYPILNFPMSAGLPSGEYQACGVLLEPQVVDVLNIENWLSIDCVDFGL
ncbi:hypothetical protein [Candidatus Venteria ishoeyi]|uniref:Caspase domain protein n=1 Tax=Candidatus Venteria ishoeyi TaxID=1899563 RepID=A0A1H6F2C3_9GAMM|nr:hypothetical protein [Candidatus Venteria ishoeyi]SEH04270.1 Uncharacterised protein [Candidatus Venteria ishoeyi]